MKYKLMIELNNGEVEEFLTYTTKEEAMKDQEEYINNCDDYKAIWIEMVA